MIKVLALFILLLFLRLANAQDGPTCVGTFPAQAQQLEVDHLGNIYLISNNQLTKYSAQFERGAVFSARTLGAMSAVDVSNPMKILVFYQELGRLVFLDNTLSRQGDAIDLGDYDMVQATLACSSYDNGFWLYEPQRSELVRFNQHLQPAQHSGNLTQQIGMVMDPSVLFESAYSVYLINPGRGVHLFDRFGAYLKTLYIDHANHVRVAGDKLYYVDGQRLISVHMKSFKEERIALPDNLVVDWTLAGNKLYVLTKDALKVFVI